MMEDQDAYLERRRNPTIPPRNPFEIFGLALCVIVGGPLLFGDAQPGTISARLGEHWMVITWGIFLSVGGAIALLGLAWKDRATGIILEQIGLVSVGIATLFYTACLLSASPHTGFVAAAIVFAFGASCLVQWNKLRNVLKRVAEIQHERKFPRKGF